MAQEFRQALKAAGFITSKQDGVYKRRIITFHSFRRFVKTTISNQFNSDYSEWFLGHSKSPYYTNKSEELKKIYQDKCMRYLTFLDYPMLEATTKDIESRLEAVISQKDKEIAELKLKVQELNRVTIRTDKLDILEEQIKALNKKLGLV